MRWGEGMQMGRSPSYSMRPTHCVQSAGILAGLLETLWLEGPAWDGDNSHRRSVPLGSRKRPPLILRCGTRLDRNGLR